MAMRIRIYNWSYLPLKINKSNQIFFLSVRPERMYYLGRIAKTIGRSCTYFLNLYKKKLSELSDIKVLTRVEQKGIFGGFHFTDKGCSLTVQNANGTYTTHQGRCVTEGGVAWCGVGSLNYQQFELSSNAAGGHASKCQAAVS